MKLGVKILGLLSLLWISHVALAVTEPLDSIAAKVNNQIITTEELNRQVAIVKQQLQEQQLKIPAEKVLKHRVIEAMIDQDLQLQLAAQVGLSVTDQEVNESLDQLAKAGNTTTQKLLAEVRQRGLSTKEFLTQLKNQLIIGKLQKAVILPQLTITPAEIDAAVRSVKQPPEIDPTTLRNQVKDRLLRRQFAQHLTTWLAQLRASAYIEITLPQ